MGNVTANKNLSTKTNLDITQLTELADNDILTVILLRVGLKRKLRAEELMLSNCGAGEDS